MTQWIDLAKALAWPIATVIAAVVLLICVLVLAGKFRSPKLHFKFPKGFEFSAGEGGSPTLTEQSNTSITDQTDDLGGSAADVALAVKPNEESVINEAFYSTPDSHRLSYLFEEFKVSPAYKDDPEFWETLYVRRRRELGIGGTADEYKKLADDNPRWVWPLLNLMRRSMEIGDFEGAERFLKEALAKESTRHRSWVLAGAIDLNFQRSGTEGCLSFINQMLSNETVTEREASFLLVSLADEIEKDDGKLHQVIFRELALRLDPANRDNRFSAAYEYLNHDEFCRIAFYHFDYILADDPNNLPAINNKGVIFQKLDDQANVIDCYSRAAALQNPMATANLADEFLKAGFINEAERTLKAIENWGDAEERAADIQRRVVAARKSTKKALDTAASRARRDYAKYQSVIGACFNYWRSGTSDFGYGEFVGPGDVRADVSEIAAKVTIGIDGKIFTGVLNKAHLSYEGSISTEGKGILGAEYRRAMVAPISDSSARLLVYARKGGHLIDATLKCAEVISPTG